MSAPASGAAGDGKRPSAAGRSGAAEERADAGAPTAAVDAGEEPSRDDAVTDGGEDATQQDEDDSSGAGGSSGASAAGKGGAGAPATAECVKATRLWSEDFESSGYAAWTGGAYGETWGDACQSTARSSEEARSGDQSQRSEIVCPYTAESEHRGYGGIQFAGDAALSQFTGSGVGIDAPYGIVNTFWIRLDGDTVFENGRWISFFTAKTACDWSNPDEVITLGIEEPSNRLAAAHYQAGAGGERVFDADAPSLPRGSWARITIYLNVHDDEMHVWQDGHSVEHVTFDRALTTICHFHWGLYASANNDDLVLFEDDYSVWKLGEAWTNFDEEPYLGEDVELCD